MREGQAVPNREGRHRLGRGPLAGRVPPHAPRHQPAGHGVLGSERIDQGPLPRALLVRQHLTSRRCLHVSRPELDGDRMDTMGALANGLAAVHNYAERLGVLEAQLAVGHHLNSMDLAFDEEATLTIYSNMIPPLCELGHTNRALKLSHTSCAKARKLMGNSHDCTINAVINHAMLLLKTGQTKDAQRFLRKELPGVHRALGPDNICTLRMRAILSDALYNYADAPSREDVGEAATVLEDAVRRATRTLGEPHPFTKQAQKHLRIVRARAAS